MRGCPKPRPMPPSSSCNVPPQQQHAAQPWRAAPHAFMLICWQPACRTHADLHPHTYPTNNHRSRYVEDGVLDAGICGYDWVVENGADVVEVCELQVQSRL